MNLVIFDCDGVLVDTEPVANVIFAESIRNLGISMTDEEALERFTGLSMSRCISILEEQQGQSLPSGWLDEMQGRTFDAFRDRGVEAVRGVAEVIGRLNRWEWPYCVASSGEHEKMALTLGLSGLEQILDGPRFSATEVSRGKPFPDLFLHAASKMGASVEKCVVIEDSVPGAQAAVRAEMKVFGYAERTAHEALEAAGAQVFDDMEQLPELLTDWSKAPKRSAL